MLAGGAADVAAGGDQLTLPDPTSFHYLSQSGRYTIEGVDDASDWQATGKALAALAIGDVERGALLKLLMGVLHLGNFTFEALESATADGSRLATDARTTGAFEQLVELWGLSERQARSALTSRRVDTKRGSTYSLGLTVPKAKQTRDALAKATYHACFMWLAARMNQVRASRKISPYLPRSPPIRHIRSPLHTSHCTHQQHLVAEGDPASGPPPTLAAAQNSSNSGISADGEAWIGLLDAFGFELLQSNSFEQLLINATNEQLQHFFLKCAMPPRGARIRALPSIPPLATRVMPSLNTCLPECHVARPRPHRCVMNSEQALYESEKIEFVPIAYKDNGPTIALLHARPLGVMPLLDEESRLVKGSDKTFSERAKGQLQGAGHEQTYQKVGASHKGARGEAAKKSVKALFQRGTPHFTVNHFAGEVCPSPFHLHASPFCHSYTACCFASRCALVPSLPAPLLIAQVCYEVVDWLEKNQDLLFDDLRMLMMASSIPLVAALFAKRAEHNKMQKAASKPSAISEEEEEVDVSDGAAADKAPAPLRRGGGAGASSSSVITAPTICTRFSSELKIHG